MKKIHMHENFIRIFLLPQEYPREFCFNNSQPVTILMVDWFHPLPQEDFWSQEEKEYTEEQLQEIRKQITNFIRQKTYYNKDYTYLAMTNYDDVFIIKGDK